MTTVTETLKEDALRDAIAYMRTLAVPGKHVSVLAGKDVYNTFCRGCHGARGDGQGPAAKNLAGVKPRDFTSKDFVIEGREEEIYRTIFMGAAKASHGSAYMPEWRTTLSRQQVQDIIEYLKTFKKPQPQ
jgi:mono/diheme cytochrome c family protein